MRKTATLLSILCISLYASAQTGPGGVGGSTTNQIWLDANQLTGLSNLDLVPTWTDESGNSNNATQGSSSRQPRYVTGAVNGLPALNFDGANDYVQIGAVPALESADMSWFIVASANNNTHTGILLRCAYSGSSANKSWWNTYITTNTNAFLTYFRENTSSAMIVDPIPYTAGYNSYTTVVDGSAQLDAYKNGTLIGSDPGTVTTTPSNHTHLRIGANTITTNAYFNGRVAEVIVYNTNLGVAERTIVQNYISSKYAISIPGALDRFAYDGTHGFHLAGIGMEGGNSNTDAQGTSLVRMNTASALSAGDYLLWGDDNATTGVNTTDIPGTYGATGRRMTRVWRVDETDGGGGDGVGTVSFSIDLDGIGFGSFTDYELLIDADGVFASGATIHTTGRSYDAGTNVLSFTDVDFSDGDYFTIGHPGGGIVSITTGIWNDPLTWNCNCIPIGSDDATVDVGHTVTVDAYSSINDLTVDGTLDFDPGMNLTVNGDFDINGAFTHGDGTLTFNGTGAQSVDGTGTIVLNNVVDSNGLGTVSVLTGTYILLDSLHMETDAAFDIGGAVSFTLRSNAAGTARIAGMRSGSSITGLVNVERYFDTPSGNAAYRNMSNPCSGTSVTLGEWDDDIYMSCVGGDDGDAWNGGSCYVSVKKYNPTLGGYIDMSSITEALSNWRGYHVWLGTDLTAMNDTTVTVTGTVNTPPNMDIDLLGGDGDWNLMGNPYCSPIDWDVLYNNIKTRRLGNFFYIFDPTTGGFEYYDGTGPSSSGTVDASGRIALGQGFWVVNDGGTGRLSFSQTSKVAGPVALVNKKAGDAALADNILRFQLSSKLTPFTGNSELWFDNNFHRRYERVDIPHLASPEPTAPALVMVSPENKHLRKNYLDELDDEVQIPFIVNVGIAGEYKLSSDNLEQFDSYDCVLVEDLLTGEFIDLRTEKNYVFQVNELHNDDTRLILHLNKDNDCEKLLVNATDPIAAEEVIIFGNQNGANITFNFEAQTRVKVSMINLLGQDMAETLNLTTQTETIQLNTPDQFKGVYLLVIDLPGERITKKLIKN